MGRIKAVNPRLATTVGCSLFFAYLLSFLFEGQVLYSLLGSFALETSVYPLLAMISHLFGLISCGYLVKSPGTVRYVMIASMGLCLAATASFFFRPSPFWLVGLVVSGYASGCVVASLGYLLKAFTQKCERLKTCADILIYSNVVMIAIDVVAVKISPILGLVLSVACVVLGILLIWTLPVPENGNQTARKPNENINQPLLLLALFVLIITINSGLMYQVDRKSVV